MTRRKSAPNLTMRVVGDQHLYRWNIGPALRAAGFRAVDLWAGPGPALTIENWRALGFDHHVVPALAQKIRPAAANKAMPLPEARRAAGALNEAARQVMSGTRETPAAPAARPVRPRMITVADVLDAHYAGRTSPTDGSPPIAPNTARKYRSAIRTLKEWIGDEPPRIITKDFLAQRFWKWKAERGHDMALLVVKHMCAALAWCAGRPPFVQPVMPPPEAYTNLRLKKTAGRRRIALPDETAALLLAFDDPAALYDELGTPLADRTLSPAPSMGDALITLLWTCARVSDGLRVRRSHLVHPDGKAMLRFRLAKNSWREEKLVMVPLLGPLADRWPSMAARSAAYRLNEDWLIIDERHAEHYIRQRREGGDDLQRFDNRWRAHRALAGQKVPSLIGEGIDPLGRPWTAFRAQDTRDTAATRIYRATGGDLEALSLYHGSSPAALVDLMRHYVEIDPTDALGVGRQLEAYAKSHDIVA